MPDSIVLGYCEERKSVGERLNVLVITTWYPTRAIPVWGIFVQHQARAIRIFNDVCVLHCQGLDRNLNHEWQMEREADTDIAAGLPTYRLHHRLSPIPKTSYIIQLWSVRQACRLIAAQGFPPQVIHAHGYEAGLLAALIGRLSHIPVVITEHASTFVTGSLRAGQLIRARFAFRLATHVLPVSHTLQRAIEHRGIHARFSVVPNAIDTGLFFPQARSGKPSPEHRILFVGSLTRLKGLEFLIPALAALRLERDDWRLDIIGDGQERAVYERQVVEAGLQDKVTFHGHRSETEIASMMRSVSFLVSASLVETFGVAIAQALAAGVPVLATRCGGPEEFVTPDVGLLVQPGDVQALRAGLGQMLECSGAFSPERISEYAAERFSMPQVGSRLDTLYRSLISPRLSRRPN